MDRGLGMEEGEKEQTARRNRQAGTRKQRRQPPALSKRCQSAASSRRSRRRRCGQFLQTGHGKGLQQGVAHGVRQTAPAWASVHTMVFIASSAIPASAGGRLEHELGVCRDPGEGLEAQPTQAMRRAAVQPCSRADYAKRQTQGAGRCADGRHTLGRSCRANRNRNRSFQRAAAQSRPSSAFSASVNTRERVWKALPSGPSREKVPPPAPSSTSMMSCVCFQVAYWLTPM